ncbi:MAG: hypothetical protein WC564_04205 [Patescibacteria group bacterium]|jgi:hypothetical protein
MDCTISILGRSGSKSLYLIGGDGITAYKKRADLIDAVNEDYVDCQRIYIPSDEQRKERYMSLRDNEQEEIEAEITNNARQKNGLNQELFQDEY